MTQPCCVSFAKLARFVNVDSQLRERRIDGRRGEEPIGGLKIVQGQAHLPHIVDALDTSCCLASGLDGRQEQGDQNGDDQIAACVQFCSLSFRKIAFICTFTVDSVITSLRAIILFDAPSVSVRKITNSRRDRLLTTSSPGCSPACKPLAGDRVSGRRGKSPPFASGEASPSACAGAGPASEMRPICRKCGCITHLPSATSSNDLISCLLGMSWRRKPQAPATKAGSTSLAVCEAVRITAFTSGIFATTLLTNSFVVVPHSVTPTSQMQAPADAKRFSAVSSSAGRICVGRKLDLLNIFGSIAN